MKKNILQLFLLLIVFAIPVLAQSGVGKLAGTIRDADTKEPLIGANIVIVGTELGAATDINGKYFILNIVPGTYDVRVSYVGYGAKVIKEVRVVAGITYDLDVELGTDFQLDEIVVTGKKLFEEKATNTTKVLDAADINKLPVKGVANLASLQSGVVISEGSGGADGNATINVRGGRGNEVLYIIDGVPQNDILFGGNAAQVSNSAIDQLSFQIGGYEAKYGQAQSGIINVTTKSGDARYSIFTDVLTSSFTDDYGYNLYTVNIGGPIIPGDSKHTIFLSGERGWFMDADPTAIPLEIPTVGVSRTTLPDNEADVWRFTGRTFHNFAPFSVRLGANINLRNFREYTHSYVKNNSEHNLRNKTSNLSFSGRLSHNMSASTFYNINLGYKVYDRERGDGIWMEQIENYGDTTANAPYLAPGVKLTQGGRVTLDDVQLFFNKGRVQNAYQRTNNSTMTLDLDFTSQLDNHLLEFGAGLQYHTLRYFSMAPVGVAIDKHKYSLEYRSALVQPYFFGYDVTGSGYADDDVFKVFSEYGDTNRYNVAGKPKNPIIAYAYLQDRFELSDLVLNIGLRLDYFDSKADILRDLEYPFAYGNPETFDAEDFKVKEAEIYLSPRIGIGFPVTSSTVFHAQYGKFIQQPTLINVFTSYGDLSPLVNNPAAAQGVNTGHISSEVTTQYEVGFRQVLGNNFGALNLTAYYKNTKGLVNAQTKFYRQAFGGRLEQYYGPANADFGTIKGFALSLMVSRISYFSFNLEYTYAIAEGTGSSTSSSATAVFRNVSGEAPKVIAPLDFDQRHTGVAILDFFVPKGDLGFLEMTSLNLIFSFNSGRPYTPLEKQNITPGGGSNLGETKGYVNSAYGPGSNRLDLKLEKSFSLGNNLILTPYLWVENVFDADNVINVYRSTGDPYTSGYLSTEEGMAIARERGQKYVDDYISLERDPFNFGIPRLIKLGFRINFSGFGF